MAAASPVSKIDGLDTLRFVAAMIVAFSHGAGPSIDTFAPGPEIWAAGLRFAVHNLYNGPAAVVVFFIISGLVIHYPQVTAPKLNVAKFLLRRIIRIALPLLAIVLVAALIGQQATGALSIVVWSLYCEIIYYCLYPALFFAFKRFGVWPIFWVSVISAFAIIVAWGNPKYYWQYPLYLMWAVALPSWLLGCVLAERVGSPRPQTAGHIWIWRLAVLGYSILAEMYFFHGPIPLSVPVLLTPFSVLSFFWIEREIEEFRLRPAPRTLEWCGKWSYSLYLVHPVVLALMLNLPLVEWISWPLRFAATMATALVFYFAVERPSHIFAKQVSKAAGARVIAI